MKRRSKLTRRSFLQLSGAGVGAVVVSDLLAACGQALGVDEEASQIDVSSLGVSDWIEVRRPDDLVVVDFGLVNLKRATIDGVVQLVKKKANKPALLVAALPAQHLFEQIFTGDPGYQAIDHRLADGSRLVFNVGAVTPIPLSIVGLLDACRRAGLNVAAGAASPAGSPEVGGSTSGTTGTRPLDPLETSLEVPFGVAVSPSQSVRFTHAAAPVMSGHRAELWHTRMAAARDVRSVRALDVLSNATTALDSATDVMTDAIRQGIRDVSGNPANPPIQVDRMTLSALGAWFDVSLDAAPSQAPFLHWGEQAVMGRDVGTRLVVAGRLHPLENKAPIVVTIDRRFTDGPLPVAYLHRESTCEVHEPVRTYHDLPGHEPEQREWPFSSIRIVTRSSPPLDGAPGGTQTFMPLVAGKPFLWDIEATDRRGETVRFSMPLTWMPENDAVLPTYVSTKVELNGQRVAFAPFEPPGPNELGPGRSEATTFETRSLNIVGQSFDPIAEYDAWFYPRVETAEIVVEALAATAGTTAPVTVKFPDAYLEHGFAPVENLNALFLQNVAGAVRADFTKGGSDKVGGFVTPNLEMAGLSRLTGPATQAMVLDPTTISAAGAFPLPFGDELNAFCPRLFGCISLLELLDQGVGLKPDDLVPKFITEAFDEVQRIRQAFDTLVTQADDIVAELQPIADAPQAVITYAAEVRAYLDGGLTSVIGKVKYAREKLEFVVTHLDTVTSAEVGEAMDALNLDLIRPLQELGQKLASDKTVQLIEYAPKGGSLLRTARRVLTGVIDVAETAQHVVDVLHEALDGFVAARDIAKDKKVRIDWRPQLRTTPYGIPKVLDLTLNNPQGLLLSVEMRAKQRGAQKAGADVLCSLEDFDLKLMNLLQLDFKRLQFRQRMGQKPEIDVVFKGIHFINELSFVETLQDILPTAGFSDPPAVKVDSKGLDASFSLDIPNVAVGVFSLEHMRIGARLLVPFLGDALSFRFEYSRRESPFLVTVAMLGGGGFFEIELTPKGLKSLVASIQFGAQLSASIGIASGSISFMGGFVYEMSGTSVALTGFLRIRGECDILGLISMCLELYLELRYADGKLTGTATLELEISVAFFTLPVKITTQRTFCGANSDPPFADVVPWDSFNEYCKAFAA